MDCTQFDSSKVEKGFDNPRILPLKNIWLLLVVHFESRDNNLLRKIMSAEQRRIRSTCDACQDSKVRCSREKPSCSRCQTQGRQCIYSYSRRLGRPRRPAYEFRTNESLDDDGSTSKDLIIPNSSSDLAITNTFPDQLNATTNTSSNTQHHTTSTSLASSCAGENPHCTAFEAASLDIEDENNVMDLFLPSGDTDFDFDKIFNSPSTFAQPGLMQSPQVEGDSNDLTSIINAGLVTTTESEFGFLDSTAGIRDSIPSATDTVQFSSQISGSSLHVRNGSSAKYNDSSQAPSDSGARTPIASQDPSTDPTALATARNIHSLANIRSQDTNIENQCNCYISLLLRLHELYENRESNSAASIDNIMKLEKDIRQQALEILACNSCVYKRSTVLILVGIVMEAIVGMLEVISLENSGLGDDFDLGKSGKVQLLSMEQHSKSTPNNKIVKNPSLRLGAYEICGEEKADFLKHLIRSRLRELSSTMRKLQDHMDQDRQSSNYKTAMTMMAEIYKHLHIVMTRLEN